MEITYEAYGIENKYIGCKNQVLTEAEKLKLKIEWVSMEHGDAIEDEEYFNYVTIKGSKKDLYKFLRHADGAEFDAETVREIMK